MIHCAQHGTRFTIICQPIFRHGDFLIKRPLTVAYSCKVRSVNQFVIGGEMMIPDTPQMYTLMDGVAQAIGLKH